MSLIDIGINLTHKRFQHDCSDVLQRAYHAGVEGIIVTGVDVASSQKAAHLCWQHHTQLDQEHTSLYEIALPPALTPSPISNSKQDIHCDLWSTAGVHPHDSADVGDDWIEELSKLYHLPRVCAVGECGLDYNRDFSPRAIQNKVFAQQIELALQYQLPLFLHEREAHQDFYAQLSPHMSQLAGAVVHCFTGDLYSLKRYLDLGCYIGITGWICDERRGQELQESVRYIPLDRILVETDAPFLTPRTLRPKPKKGRNEPAFLVHIVEQLAHYMHVDPNILAHASYTNSCTLFNLATHRASYSL